MNKANIGHQVLTVHLKITCIHLVTGVVKGGAAIRGVRLAPSTEIQPFAVDACALLRKLPGEYIKHTSYSFVFYSPDNQYVARGTPDQRNKRDIFT